MISQPPATVVDNTISDIKCSFATLFSNKFIEEEYMIRLCKTSELERKSFKEKMYEKSLQIFLLEHLAFLNRKDDYGRDIIGCDLNKIYNLK